MILTPRVLTDEEYAILKKKLHHAHDTIIKVTLYENESVRELMSKIIMPLLNGIKIDLDGLKLDKNTYIRPNLQVFYSDVVYLTTLIDEKNNLKELIDLAFLIEHKSEMPTELSLRLQFVDYINGIMKKNYDPKTDKTIPVIAIVFNQFDKEWEMKPYRSLFPQLSAVSRFLLEFDYLVINLASLSDEIMDSLDKFGTLKAALLAMRYVRKKEFLKTHFEEIFLFLQEHPEKTDLRDQLIAYVLGESDFTVQELEELLNNIFSPILKQEIMITGAGFLAVSAREAAIEREARLVAEKAAQVSAVNAQKARATSEKLRREALQSIMRGWYLGVPLDLLMNVFDLSPQKITEFISTFEKVKTYCSSKTTIDMKELRKLSGLKDAELKPLLALLQQKK
jgi:Putative transposase, YhgA-like